MSKSETFNVGETSFSHLVQDLTPFVSYDVSVWAVNPGGQSDVQRESFMTLEDGQIFMLHKCSKFLNLLFAIVIGF